MDVGHLIVYMYIIQKHINFEGEGEDSPSWSYVEKPCHMTWIDAGCGIIIICYFLYENTTPISQSHR